MVVKNVKLTCKVADIHEGIVSVDGVLAHEFGSDTINRDREREREQDQEREHRDRRRRKDTLPSKEKKSF